MTREDIARAREILDAHKSSGLMMISTANLIALTRVTVKDPYERMRLLYNLGVRGPELAR